jgi:hypothetical protein
MLKKGYGVFRDEEERPWTFDDVRRKGLQNNLTFSILFYKISLVEFSLRVKNVLGAVKWVFYASSGPQGLSIKNDLLLCRMSNSSHIKITF